MLAFLRTFAAVVFAFAFLAIVPLLVLGAVAMMGDTGPRKDSWLTVRLSGPLLEYAEPPTLRGLFEEPPPHLMQITENLEKAAVDERILGVIMRLDGFAAGTGKLDEIRAGIRRVQEAGKPVYAHTGTLTDGGLYLASECDSIFLSPKGDVVLLGRGAQIQHFRGSLDLLGVNPQFHTIGEYKSWSEMFTREDSSPEALENLGWLVDELEAGFVRVLERNRGLSAETIAELRTRSVLRGPVALAEGLVDELLWWDELSDRLRGARDELRTISSPAYAEVSRRSLKLSGRDRIAVVHAQGFVAATGEDRFDTTLGIILGPDRVIADLDRVREDDGVKAVILRWDTGGGATVGGERIARAIERLRDEKPVVVSVADVAASAGYTMSFPANRIVCPRHGITGSIGSITGKFNLNGLYEKLGITHDTVLFAPNALLWSELTDFTPEQWEIIGGNHRARYDEWVAEIANARGLAEEDVHAVARGQVWTGSQAKERGLVDELGVFWAALDVARELADLEPDTKVDLVHYPIERSTLDLILAGEFHRLGANEVALFTRSALQGGVLRGVRSVGWEPAGNWAQR